MPLYGWGVRVGAHAPLAARITGVALALLHPPRRVSIYPRATLQHAGRRKGSDYGSSVADVMVATLKASGVRRVYGMPGDSLNGFTDALRRDGGIAWEHVRHEEAAAFAAAARGRAHRRARGVRGELRAGQPAPDQRPVRRQPQPGAGAGDRRAHPEEEIGAGYFQETHPQELFRECSVYCELVSVPEQLPRRPGDRDADRAGSAAGSPSSSIPGEVFLADAPPARSRCRSGRQRRSSGRTTSSLAAAAEVLNAAQRVTILAGAGCAGAHDQLIALARAAAGAGRARVARQGVRRVRQPLRRRHDRPARVHLRLPGDGALRRAAHARHRLPLPAVLPARACR